MLRKSFVNLVGFFGKILLQRQNRNFVRSERGMKMHNHSGVAALENLFLVSVAKECQQRSFYAQGRFDNVWHIFFVCYGVGVFHRFAGLGFVAL